MHGRPPYGLFDAEVNKESKFKIYPYQLVSEVPGYLVDEESISIKKEDLVRLLKEKTQKAEEIIAKL